MKDLLNLDDLLTTEELLIQKTVTHFVDEDVLPVIADAYDQAYFPNDFIKKIAGLGLLGMTLPEEYGGAGAGAVAYGVACQALERGDSGLRSFVSVQGSLCMYPVFVLGSEEQKQRFLPRMAKGELIGCFGLTEPDVGSDPSHMKTTAKRTKGGWVLNGAKTWITNAPIADVAIVWAKTEEGIRAFIVEKDFPGFERLEIEKKLSLRASPTGELVFADCFVPDENYLEGSEKGLASAFACLTQARYGIAWGAIGSAMACFDIASTYAKERLQFEKPLASYQLIQKDLVDMYNEIQKAQLLNIHLGRLKEKNELTFQAVSLAKMNNCREALNIARKARNLLGANGISLEYHVIRHMTNLESVFTYEGTDNIHHLIVGKYLTGIDAIR